MPYNQVPSTRRRKARSHIAILFALIALALTALPTASFASTDTAGNVLATEVDSTPSGVEGDLYWAGQSLNLDDASIGRDIIAAGESLSIRDCTVGGAVRLAARTIDIAKTTIDGSVTVAGQHVVLNTGSTANCFYAAGETVALRGSAKSAALAGDTVTIDGTVDGDVEVWADKLILGKNARITGTVNAVNITDGVDGLSSSVTLPVCAFFAASFGYAYLHWDRPGSAGMTVFAAALFGGLVGFLVYNFYPAKVFMGDTGSLFLGGAVCGMAKGTLPAGNGDSEPIPGAGRNRTQWRGPAVPSAGSHGDCGADHPHEPRVLRRMPPHPGDGRWQAEGLSPQPGGNLPPGTSRQGIGGRHPPGHPAKAQGAPPDRACQRHAPDHE